METKELNGAVFAKDMTPEQRRDWVENHDDYQWNFYNQKLPEVYHTTLGFLSNRKLAKPFSCTEGFFG